MPAVGQEMYRYVDEVRFFSGGENLPTLSFSNGTRVSIRRETWIVRRLTPRGFWVGTPLGWGRERFVLAKARKRFCHETDEAAIASFVARKRSQCQLLIHQLRRARLALNLGRGHAL